jgi:hypothetical protein
MRLLYDCHILFGIASSTCQNADQNHLLRYPQRIWVEKEQDIETSSIESN